MSNISQDKLLELVDSRYSLVTLAAKRAKQIREGAPKLVVTDATNPLTIAMEEIQAGKVTFDVPDNDEPVAAATEDTAMLGLPAAPEGSEEALPKPEDILPVPEEMQAVTTQTEEEEALPGTPEELLTVPEDMQVTEPEPEEAEEPEAEVTAEDAGDEITAAAETPESNDTEQASQPEE